MAQQAKGFSQLAQKERLEECQPLNIHPKTENAIVTHRKNQELQIKVLSLQIFPSLFPRMESAGSTTTAHRRNQRPKKIRRRKKARAAWAATHTTR